MIKTIFGTTIFWIIVLLAGWIYMTSMQSDALYNFFDMANPATKAVSECYSGFAAVEESITTKLDEVITLLNNTPSTGEIAVTTTGSNITTGTLNEINFITGSTN